MSNVEAVAFGGRKTPKQILIDALRYADEFTDIIIIAQRRDPDDENAGYVEPSWSDGSLLVRLGMCEVAKRRMMDFAEVEEDEQDPGA